MNPNYNYNEYFNYLSGHTPTPSTSRNFPQPPPPYQVPSLYQSHSQYNSNNVGSIGSSYRGEVYYETPVTANLTQPYSNYRMANSGYGNAFLTPHPYATAQKLKGPEPNKVNVNDEDFSEKLIAYARFNRNTDLMKTILSEEVVPDVRNVVMTSRWETLKEQVRGLETHKNKMDEEVKEIEKVCVNRKRKFMESTAAYHAKYKKLSTPIGIKMYNEMVDKYYNYWKQQDEIQKWEKTLAWAQQTAAATSPTLASDSSPELAEILGVSATEGHQNNSCNPNSEFDAATKDVVENQSKRLKQEEDNAEKKSFDNNNTLFTNAM